MAQWPSGHTHHEALQSPVVRVQQEAGHRAHLSSPVPAIGTMNKHTCPFLWNCLKNRMGKGWLSTGNIIRISFGFVLAERIKKRFTGKKSIPKPAPSFIECSRPRVVRAEPRRGLVPVTEASLPFPYIQEPRARLLYHIQAGFLCERLLAHLQPASSPPGFHLKPFQMKFWSCCWLQSFSKRKRQKL